MFRQEVMAVACDKSGAHNQPEDRAAMIAATDPPLASMLRSRVQSSIPEPSVSAWVPTRMIRGPLPLSARIYRLP
jgi:hypothetical protein